MKPKPAYRKGYRPQTRHTRPTQHNITFVVAHQQRATDSWWIGTREEFMARWPREAARMQRSIVSKGVGRVLDEMAQSGAA